MIIFLSRAARAFHPYAKFSIRFLYCIYTERLGDGETIQRGEVFSLTY